MLAGDPGEGGPGWLRVVGRVAEEIKGKREMNPPRNFHFIIFFFLLTKGFN